MVISDTFAAQRVLFVGAQERSTWRAAYEHPMVLEVSAANLQGLPYKLIVYPAHAWRGCARVEYLARRK